MGQAHLHIHILKVLPIYFGWHCKYVGSSFSDQGLNLCPLHLLPWGQIFTPEPQGKPITN